MVSFVYIYIEANVVLLFCVYLLLLLCFVYISGTC